MVPPCLWQVRYFFLCTSSFKGKADPRYAIGLRLYFESQFSTQGKHLLVLAQHNTLDLIQLLVLGYAYQDIDKRLKECVFHISDALQIRKFRIMIFITNLQMVLKTIGQPCTRCSISPGLDRIPDPSSPVSSGKIIDIPGKLSYITGAKIQIFTERKRAAIPGNQLR
jgi:hypothetical protein